MNSLDAFTFWLPGELRYAALKGGEQSGYENSGYKDRIARARRGTGDGSMYTFLGTEWHHAQLAGKNGFHYSPNHAKSGQLQYAKFAAGLFDKFAAIDWLRKGLPAFKEDYEWVASYKAQEVIDKRPWSAPYTGFEPAEELSKQFEDTMFAPALLELQQAIVEIADNPQTNERLQLERNASLLALHLGGRATQCYVSYTEANLTPDQYVLPVSILAA